MHTHLAILYTALFFVHALGVDYYSPADNGGSMLDQSNGLGEPLNVIISAQSDPEILTKNGFNKYALAVGFGTECFNQHIGTPQKANLGDGNGWMDQIEVLREDFNNPVFGTCLESATGGNHLRLWQQNGPDANSGALFLAVSQEEGASQNHQIVEDGYNIGRDNFVDNAVGTKDYLFKRYTTTVQDIPGLLDAGSSGLNHGIAQDGIVKLLTVHVESIL